MMSFVSSAHILRAQLAIILIAVLPGCSMFNSSFFGGGPTKPQPAALQGVSGAVSAKQVWSARIGQVNFPLDVNISGSTVFVAVATVLSRHLMHALAAMCGGPMWAARLPPV